MSWMIKNLAKIKVYNFVEGKKWAHINLKGKKKKKKEEWSNPLIQEHSLLTSIFFINNQVPAWYKHRPT